MKVLVTGATGFIGLEVSRQLSKMGLKPNLLVRRPLRASVLASLEANIVQGDLTSPESLERACAGIDTIIHLGARAIFEEYSRVKPTIVEGSSNLMRAASFSGVKRFIYASSLLVYNSQKEPIGLDTPVDPQCGYGIAKVEAEGILSRMAQDSGIQLGIIRFPHVYGPCDLMFDQVQKGHVFFPGSGKNCFAHMHVEDAARVLIAAAAQGWSGTSAIADDLAVSWNAFFAEIKKYYPRFRAYSVPKWLSLLFTWIHFPIRYFSHAPSVYTPGSVVSWNLNLLVKKGLLWDQLGLQPNFHTIYEGIPNVLDHCIPFLWTPAIKDRFG